MAQFTPTRISDTPITAMMLPVTTGGNRASRRLMKGAISMETTPAPITAPKMPVMPRAGLFAMASMGLTAAKVTPIMTGRRMPKYLPIPRDWIRVTRPQQNRSALISAATCSGGSLSARPTISGTAMAPAYMTSTCCKPRVNSLPAGRISSTGDGAAGMVPGTLRWMDFRRGVAIYAPFPG